QRAAIEAGERLARALSHVLGDAVEFTGSLPVAKESGGDCMSAPKISAPRLQVKRVVNTPREEVFRAWTQADELKRWFAPTDDHRVEVPQLELHVGGAYRFEIHHKGGTVHRVHGIYREILPPEKLVFTWQWDGHCDVAVTV